MLHSKKASRPRKPRPDFPLFPHASGRWAKKIRGQFIYFGKVADDPRGHAALELWLDQKDDLLAGRTPRLLREGITVRDLCNTFLTAKKQLVDSCEIAERTFTEYHNVCERLVGAFGKNRLVVDLAADDFEKLRTAIARKCGPVRLGNEVQRVRTVFKYGYDAGLLDKPVRFGPQFKKPAQSVLRKHRAASGSRMLESTEVRAMIDGAMVQLRAMLLLAVNAGLGNSDCGQLEFRHLEKRGCGLPPIYVPL